MPRKPKFVHPLRAVRAALDKSQPQFGNMFGVSASYIQAIELGQRKLTDELADAIMLRFGVDAESLKRKRGAPVSLIGKGKAEVTLWSGPSDKRGDMEMVYKVLQKERDPAKRFRLSIGFWQKAVVPIWKSERWRVRDGLDNKLQMLFEAAEREKKYLALAMRLSRWIENAATEFRLQTTINVVRKTRTGCDAEWPTFMETLSQSFRLLPPSPQKKQRPSRRQKKSRFALRRHRHRHNVRRNVGRD